MYKLVLKDNSWRVGYTTSFMTQDEYELTLGEADLKDHYSLVDPLFKIPELEDIGYDYLAYTNEVLSIDDQVPRKIKEKERQLLPVKLILIKNNETCGTLLYKSDAGKYLFQLKLTYYNPNNKKKEEYEINKYFEDRVLLKDAIEMLQNRIREKIVELKNFKFRDYEFKYMI